MLFCILLLCIIIISIKFLILREYRKEDLTTLINNEKSLLF